MTTFVGRKAKCPSCGASVAVRSAAISLRVEGSCQCKPTGNRLIATHEPISVGASSSERVVFQGWPDARA
jgi:hypothetical protein